MQELEQIIEYLVSQGVLALEENTDERDFSIDYVAVFARDDDEFNDLILQIESFGTEVDKEMSATGVTFKLDKSLETSAGKLDLIKIRKPDKTRPQRGAPDFKVNRYDEFKENYLQTSGNFTLMVREDYEMIELKGEDVLVYIPNKALSERM